MNGFGKVFNFFLVRLFFFKFLFEDLFFETGYFTPVSKPDLERSSRLIDM